ncbi:MAG: cell division protein FtsL [Gammaproteobacteria bacterium]|nr:MAG: cell division protein FtsL [Gammaproteobacteria bacterium]
MMDRKMLAIAVPLLWVAALGSAAGAIYCKHRAREMFVELERLNARRDNLEIEWGQLQLEQSAWSTHAFVERVASTKLHMAMTRRGSSLVSLAGGSADHSARGQCRGSRVARCQPAARRPWVSREGRRCALLARGTDRGTSRHRHGSLR